MKIEPKRNTALHLAIWNADVTQRKIAELVGMHPTELSAIVNGRRLPDADERRALAKVLGKSEAELFQEWQEALSA